MKDSGDQTPRSADDPAPGLRPDSDHLLGSARRAHIAELLIRNLPKLRSAARRKLTSRTRAVHDSEDVFASVLRRIDRLALEGRLEHASDDELLRLAYVIAGNQAVSRTRAIERLSALHGEDSAYAQLMLERLHRCRDDEDAGMVLSRIACGITDTESRQLFLLRSRGVSSAAIGQLMDLSADAVRQRWSVLRASLERRLKAGEFDERL